MLSWNVIHRSYPVTWWKWAFRQLRYLLFWGVDFSNLSSSLYFIHLLFLPWSSLSPLITSCKRRIPHSRSTHSKSTHTVQIQDRRSVKMRESEEGEGTVPWIASENARVAVHAYSWVVIRVESLQYFWCMLLSVRPLKQMLQYEVMLALWFCLLKVPVALNVGQCFLVKISCSGFFFSILFMHQCFNKDLTSATM